MRAKTSQIERYIREAAVKRGINPDVAVKVAKSEGLKPGAWQSTFTKNGRREKSYGPFQLNVEKGRLGVQFTKATGLDPRDPETVFSQIDFALDHAAKNGWGAWYGAAKVGVANRQGLSKARPVGVQAAPQIAQATQAAPAKGLLASFFSDPLGMQAQAAEAPSGLAAFAAPDMETGNSPARLDAAFARAKAQPALSQPSFDTRFGAMPSPARFDARPQVNVSGPVSPEHYASVTPASSRARAAFDAAAQGLGAPDLSTPASKLGGLAGSMVGPAPAEQGRMSPDGQVADPFGTMVSKSVPDRMPDTALAYGPQAAPAAPPGLGAPAQSAAAPTASLGLAAAAPTQFGGLLGRGIANMGLYAQTNPEMADIAGTTIADPNETYPDAPTPENTFPAAPDEPTESMFGPKTKRALAGLMLGGPVGAALGLASGMFSGGLGGPAGRAPADIDAGYGLGAMQAGMYGPRGTFGRSLSNPNTFAVSRGPNQGFDLTNQYGARTTYGPSGDIRANKDTMKAWGSVLGGLFGGSDKKSDKDKDKSGKGLGGSGYSGKGLY